MTSRLIFPSAKEARRLSFNRVRVHDEVRKIEEEILNAINNGQMEVSINNTFMTSNTQGNPSPEDYYDVWQNKTGDRILENEMKSVLSYFGNLGYSIARQTNNNTTFYWNIKW